MSAGRPSRIRRPLRVVFVCTGNTCRSPIAEGLFRARVAERGLEGQLTATSAGTSAWGEPIADNSRLVLKERGVDLSGHISRSLDEAGVGEADFIVTMTSSQRRQVLSAFPGMDGRRVRTLLPGGDVPDPVGLPISEYERTARMIEAAIDPLIDDLLS